RNAGSKDNGRTCSSRLLSYEMNALRRIETKTTRNIETDLEFLLRPRQPGLSLDHSEVVHWLRPNRRKWLRFTPAPTANSPWRNFSPVRASGLSIRAIAGHGRAAVTFLRNRPIKIFSTFSTSCRKSLKRLLSVGASGLHRIRFSLLEEASAARQQSCYRSIRD